MGAILLYLKASNLFLVLSNQLLQLLKLLVSLIVLLLAFMLYCNRFLQNRIFPDNSLKLFLIHRIFLFESKNILGRNQEFFVEKKMLQVPFNSKQYL